MLIDKSKTELLPDVERIQQRIASAKEQALTIIEENLKAMADLPQAVDTREFASLTKTLLALEDSYNNPNNTNEDDIIEAFVLQYDTVPSLPTVQEGNFEHLTELNATKAEL